jgi:hypothetical protein
VDVVLLLLLLLLLLVRHLLVTLDLSHLTAVRTPHLLVSHPSLLVTVVPVVHSTTILQSTF